MRSHRPLFALLFGSVAAAAVNGCDADRATESDYRSVAQPVSIQKTYTRKIFVHMMPWFQVGGQHWSMNSRNSATGIASWYSPMIGEYSSDNGDVDAARADMTYVRDNFFSKPNHMKVSGKPALMVFGPQKFRNPGDWTNILSVFPTKPTFFALWYNDTAGSNADGKFAWIAQNGLKGVNDFDNGLDGVNHGLTIPVLYPGFNSYYANGGWAGPTWKISYTLKADNTEGGDTFQSTFEMGKYGGDPLQIATWNDYGEGTMVEPTNQFQYKFLTTLQRSVGAVYTDAELKIVKMLFDQRKQFGASKQAQLDQASTALANLDVATACGILGCTAPVHDGAGGAAGAGGATGSGGSRAGSGGVSGAGGATAGTGGSSGTAGKPGGPGGAGPGNGGGAGTGVTGHASAGCSVLSPIETRPSGPLIAAAALALAACRRRRRH